MSDLGGFLSQAGRAGLSDHRQAFSTQSLILLSDQTDLVISTSTSH